MNTVIPINPNHLARARASLPCDVEERPVTNWTLSEEREAEASDSPWFFAVGFFAGVACTAMIFGWAVG